MGFWDTPYLVKTDLAVRKGVSCCIECGLKGFPSNKWGEDVNFIRMWTDPAAGVHKAKAVNIVHGQVATQARGLIITACAGTRSDDRQQNLVSLLGWAFSSAPCRHSPPPPLLKPPGILLARNPSAF